MQFGAKGGIGVVPASTALPAVRLLGPIEVVGPDGPATLVGSRQRVLLALLALSPGRVLAPSRLVDALWGDDPPRTAVRTLHSHVARVRQALQASGFADALVTRDHGYQLTMAPEQVDAHLFEQAVRLAAADLAEDRVERAAGRLRDGLALWRGDALADGVPEGWASAEVDRLHQVRLAAEEDLWGAELRLGRHAAAIGELERLLVGNPSREGLVGLLMLALYRAGRHADALDRYERLRARLVDELGADPGPRLQRLHTAILRREPELDLATPAASPAAAHAMPVPAQLPAPVGHFAGRGAELAALDRWYRERDADTDSRVVVVSGPAGMGKTAFTVQWLHRIRDDFPDGQLFLDLRGHDPDLALTDAEALAHALRGLGVPSDRVPPEPAEQVGLFRSLTHGRRILIVLDNGGSADHVAPLVPNSPGSLLVVTSRRQLAGVAVQHAVHAVELEALDGAEAVALLGGVIGADRLDREREQAAELVELCGRMPLAVRIAAAKLAARPRQRIAELVEELAGEDRLDALSVEGDSRSVRNVFASAYHALSEPAARLFRLLGLHPGSGFSTWLAAALTGVSRGRARRAVDELVAAHLIAETDSGRYRFHDLIRLYAQERVRAEEAEPARADGIARILDWYLGVAAAGNRILDPGRDRVVPVLAHPLGEGEVPFADTPAAVLAFLDGERANLVPTVQFATRTGRDAAAWQLSYLFAGYFESRGHWVDRVAMYRCGLAAAQHLGDPATEGLMESGLGVACIAARRFAEALEHLPRALDLMRAGGDKRGEGHAHNNMATAYAELRRFEDAVQAYRRALAVHTANGHRMGTTLVLNNLGYLFAQTGETAAAAEHLRGALELARDAADSRLEAAVLHSLGQADRLAGRAEDALDHLGTALALRREIGDRRYEARTLTELGLAHLLRGDHAAALETFGAAARLAGEVGDQHVEALALANLGGTHLAAGELGQAGEQLRLALALRTRIADDYEEATVHRSLGELARASGDVVLAARHWDRAGQLYRKVNATVEADALAALTFTAPPTPRSGSPGTARAGTPRSRTGHRS